MAVNTFFRQTSYINPFPYIFQSTPYTACIFFRNPATTFPCNHFCNRIEIVSENFVLPKQTLKQNSTSTHKWIKNSTSFRKLFEQNLWQIGMESSRIRMKTLCNIVFASPFHRSSQRFQHQFPLFPKRFTIQKHLRCRSSLFYYFFIFWRCSKSVFTFSLLPVFSFPGKLSRILSFEF